MKLILPTPLSRYRGKRYYRFHVRLMQSGLDRTIWEHSEMVPVISDSAVKAVQLVQDECAPLLNYPAEFECLGPKGGITSRFTGYQGLIGAKLYSFSDNGHQLMLPI